MARIHSIKVNVQPAKQTHTFGNTGTQNASVWTVENNFTIEIYLVQSISITLINLDFISLDCLLGSYQ